MDQLANIKLSHFTGSACKSHLNENGSQPLKIIILYCMGKRFSFTVRDLTWSLTGELALVPITFNLGRTLFILYYSCTCTYVGSISFNQGIVQWRYMLLFFLSKIYASVWYCLLCVFRPCLHFRLTQLLNILML